MKKSSSTTPSPSYCYTSSISEKGRGAPLEAGDQYHGHANDVARSPVDTKKERKAATVAKPAPAESEYRRLERRPTMEDINESADAFIKKFRQQLLLQRLESLENYEKMLARGL